MNILIYSPVFYPSVGGLETVVSILAHEFFSQGHEVKLVSKIPATDSKFFPFEVIRQPQPNQLLELTRWCDVYFQPNISLKGIWPLLISPKPWIASHNSWYTRTDQSLGWQDYLKHFAIRFATGISVSQAVAKHVATPSTVIPNPYQEDIFYKTPEITRDKELIFLGRLVSDKGADLLLNALANLKTSGITPKLTIVGTGPEEAKLHQQVKDLDILHQVDFVGVKVGDDLAKLLNAHQILVVPSRWQEPFGIVALEGIACGCVIIGSEGGGLKEAIGSCGVTFANGNLEALTQVMISLLTDNTQLVKYQEQAESHLAQHRQVDIAKSYLTVFQQAIRKI
jgi:glycogen synthase